MEDKELLDGIRYLNHPEEGEYVHGKQKALELAAGQYIAFLSAQDSMQKERMAQIIAAFHADHSAFLFYTDMQVQQSHSLGTSHDTPPVAELKYLSQIVFHKDCFQMIGGFDGNLIALCDQDLLLRAHFSHLIRHLDARPECAIGICPEEYQRVSPLKEAIGCRQLLVKYDKFFKKNKKYRHKLYFQIAANYKKAGYIFRYLQFRTKTVFAGGSHRRKKA